MVLAQGNRSPALAALGLGLVGRRRAGRRGAVFRAGGAAGRVVNRLIPYLVVIGYLLCVLGAPALIVLYLRPVTTQGLLVMLVFSAMLSSAFVICVYHRLLTEALSLAQKSSNAAKDAISIARDLEKTVTEAQDLTRGAITEHDREAGKLQDIQRETDRLEKELANLQKATLQRGRGRPAGVISIPTDHGKAINLTITEAMPYLVKLSEARGRGELAQACKANPWGSPEIPEGTARGWLRRYKSEITAARNSGITHHENEKF